MIKNIGLYIMITITVITVTILHITEDTSTWCQQLRNLSLQCHWQQIRAAGSQGTQLSNLRVIKRQF